MLAQAAKTKKRSRWRWLIRIALALGLAIGLLALPLACTTTIVPPAQPLRPVTIYLLDYGHTSGLILPSDNGGMTAYVYGDWNYYALGNQGIFDGIRALAWPTQGALGHREMPDAKDEKSLRRSLGAFESLYRLQVELSKAEQLRDRLNAILNKQQEDLVVNVSFDLVFASHPRNYSYFHNSNHVVADWLRELGCQVRGPAFSSRWNVSSS